MTPAYLVVKVDGTDLNTLSQDAILMSGDLVYELNAHATCELHYRQSPDFRFPVENWIGKELMVSAVDLEGQQANLFVGFLSAVDLHYEISGAYDLHISGVTRSILMDQTPRLRSHTEKNLAGHLEKLVKFSLGQYQGSFEPSGPMQSDFGLLQVGESDFRFLGRIADRFGLAFRVLTDGIEVLDHYVDAGCTVEWRREGGLSDFRLVGQLAAAEFTATVYDRDQFTSDETNTIFSAPKFGPAGQLIDAADSKSASDLWKGSIPDPFISRSLDALANEVELESRRQAQRRVYAVGQSAEATIRAGQKLTISGPIDAAGDWGVVKVIHRWRPDGYRNEFIASPYTGPLGWERPPQPRHPGLMVARVVALGEDDHEGMVKIQFPWEPEDPWLWARFLTPYAGKDRGIYFSPEIGDEVMVSFEYGDTNRPIVVGSMWNGQEKPPTEMVFGGEYRENDVKRIVTKSGNRMVMDDQGGNETIVLATPNHVRVSMFDGGSKLLLHSDGDIHINAGGTVHMKCAKFLREVG